MFVKLLSLSESRIKNVDNFGYYLLTEIPTKESYDSNTNNFSALLLLYSFVHCSSTTMYSNSISVNSKKTIKRLTKNIRFQSSFGINASDIFGTLSWWLYLDIGLKLDWIPGFQFKFLYQCAYYFWSYHLNIVLILVLVQQQVDVCF